MKRPIGLVCFLLEAKKKNNFGRRLTKTIFKIKIGKYRKSNIGFPKLTNRAAQNQHYQT